MSKHLTLSIFLSLFVLTFSCTTPQETPVLEDMTNIPFTREVTMDTSLVLVINSSGYSNYQTVRNAAEKKLNAQGIQLSSEYQGNLDSNLIVAFSAVSDLSKAKQYLGSDQLITDLGLAATDQNIQTIFLDQQLQYTRETNDTLVFYMSFKTVSYERWEKAFLDDYREDASKDFEVTNVFRGLEDRDQVHMVFKVNDPNYVETMEKSNAFRMKMLAAGVVSYPVTYKLKPASTI